MDGAEREGAVMRDLILIGIVAYVIAFFLSACDGDRKSHRFYDLDVRLVDANSGQGMSGGKRNRPVACRLWLVQSLRDTTMFAELSGCHDFMITDEMWYGRGVGDTLHFEWIRKDRFFKMSNRYRWLK